MPYETYQFQKDYPLNEFTGFLFYFLLAISIFGMRENVFGVSMQILDYIFYIWPLILVDCT
jgi:hypothetical protein